jgi:hypothetical protein
MATLYVRFQIWIPAKFISFLSYQNLSLNATVVVWNTESVVKQTIKVQKISRQAQEFSINTEPR